MDTDEDLLQRLAAGGAIDYSVWPRLLCTVVSRLETIAHNDFSIPNIPPPKPLQLSPLSPVRSSTSAGANGAHVAIAAAPASDGASPSPDANKENTTPALSQTAEDLSNGRSAGMPATPVASATAAAAALPAVSSPPGSSHTEAEGPLPVQIADLLNRIITTLTTTFAQYPPHTIQRLSELILTPRRHYRNVTSYLHAVDRVATVTSGSNTYPLPPAISDMSAMSLLANGVIPSASTSAGAAATANGDVSAAAATDSANASLNVGSDEALGGALLTPIPWLRPRPNSSGDEHTDGSSPPSSSDSGDGMIGSDGDGGSGSDSIIISGGLVLNTLSAQSAPSPQQQSQSPQPQSQQQQSSLQEQQSPQGQSQSQHKSPSHRIEGHVRTESTETIDGPNGVGSIETVSVSVNGIPSHGAMTAAVQLQQQRGITQGELLRQEQKAGVVPVSQLARAAAAAAAVSGVAGGSGGGGGGNNFKNHFHGRMDEDEDGADVEGEETGTSEQEEAGTKSKDGETQATEEDEDEEEVPHARGPDEIGAADMGPQPDRGSDPHSIDLEAAVGRKAVPLPGAAAAISGRHAATMKKVTAAEAEAGSAEAVPETSVGHPQIVRASTPKREAEESLRSSVPTKRLKEEEEGSKMDTDTDTEADATKPAKEASRDKAAKEPAAMEEKKQVTTAMAVDRKNPANKGNDTASKLSTSTSS
ncbi:hypothetical protein CMQ_4263 [Grosmannia clavigera kw1407]|uniref:Protein phosphatase 4 core regulatory subunit R2 n=1 Tax=Grosmannia clavigera (strain kw1407 / UAMH 11150) TaxID=655863 RepID=F0XU73_GROCL|nr:uncharacterized protein CMQ_4263 [Grosmannia clavigera kw1407]EFW98411.1 hypothetical protein CMQ_4263 [Grosmannia clavigera kw1407]